MTRHMYLAMDIGGTKVDYLYYTNKSQIHSEFVQTVATNDFDSMDHLLSHLLVNRDIDRVIMGVAGPVSGSEIRLTNVPWSFDVANLGSSHNCSISVLNDVEAIGYAIPHLSEDDKATYKLGKPGANELDIIISVGTGLGVAISDGEQVFASEAGHIPFWLNDVPSLALVEFLRETSRYISFEQVCSAMGISNIVKALENDNFLNIPSSDLSVLTKSKNPTRVILENVASKNPRNSFQGIFNMLIHHLALYIASVCYAFRPRSIYLSGGIGRVIANHFANELLKQAKDVIRMKNIFEDSSFHGLLDEYTGLKGVAWFGLRNNN